MNVLKLGLLGIGAWILYNYLTTPEVPTDAAPGQPQQTPSQPQQQPAAPPSTQSAGPLYTADEWNWFRQQQTGVVQPAPEAFGFTGDGRFVRVTESDYNARRAAAGLAGLLRSAWSMPSSWSMPSAWTN